MCGVAGIWFFENKVNDCIIKEMTDIQSHRGPDGEGQWVSSDRTLQLGHRRLSIIDLSEKGKQPLMYQNKYVITFNGEIYNYLELRDLLLSKGYEFRSDTDTEVILAAYDYWKEDCLNIFDGMFAMAIYDIANEELFCARDRFGEKPFHYFQSKECFAFASEIKALWKTGVQNTVDNYSMYLYLNYGLHEDPKDSTRTFYKNIKKLKPSHYFKLKKGTTSIEQKRYWRINLDEQNKSISFENACEQFKELFFKSVSLRLRSDVSVGTSLSGGLDSSAVVCAVNSLRNKNNRQTSFSARCHNKELDEGDYINNVIKSIKTLHYEVYQEMQDYVDNMQNIMYHQDEPFNGASVYAQWAVFRLAKEKGIGVLLDGQGADEYLAGYNHFFSPYFKETYSKKGKQALHNAIAEYRENNISQTYIDLTPSLIMEAKYPLILDIIRLSKTKIKGVQRNEIVSDDLYNAYKHEALPFAHHPSLNKMLYHYTFNEGLSKLLRFADRNSMAHSREVRLPFLSHKLVEFVFTLPADYKIRNGWTKALLRHSFNGILPNEITWRKNKFGFFAPQKDWEQTESFKQILYNYNKLAYNNGYIQMKKNSISWRGYSIGLFLDNIKRQ